MTTFMLADLSPCLDMFFKLNVCFQICPLDFVINLPQTVWCKVLSLQHNPRLLPHYEMLRLLLQVIGTASARIQQLASVALVEVCHSISGDEGCATASHRDIRTLLGALMSPCVACRDSALQVFNTCLIQLWLRLCRCSSMVPNISLLLS